MYLRTRLALLITLSAILAVASGCGGAKPVQESVIVRDTIVITKERKLVDTLMLFRDTTIYQDRVKVKIEYRDNFVNVEADCPPDTLRVETIKIVTEQPKEKKSKWTWEGLLGWSIAILCLLVILKQFAEQLFKKLF
jgi:hypothetical protein